MPSREKSTHSESQILHHATETTGGIVTGSSVVRLAGEEVLDAAVRVDLHGGEVVEAVDEAGLLAELLGEGVGQVVGGVGGDEEDGAADAGQLDGQGA